MVGASCAESLGDLGVLGSHKIVLFSDAQFVGGGEW